MLTGLRIRNFAVIDEVEVTFSDASGELTSTSDVESVGPGATVAWSVSDDWPEAPSGGLRCAAAPI